MPDNTFDVVSKIEMPEVHNAVQQALKEVLQRFDLKESHSSIEFQEKDNKILLHSKDEFKLKAVVDILQSKLIKRQVPLKGLTYGEIVPAAGSTVKQEITMQQGIAIEKAREMVKKIKDSKLKVQASIQGDFVRVASKDRDTLQAAIKLLRDTDFGIDMQFTNYRTNLLAAPYRVALDRRAGRPPRGPIGGAGGRAVAPGGRGLPSASALRRDHAQQSGLSHGARIASRGRGGATVQLPRRGPERGPTRPSYRRNRGRARRAGVAARTLSQPSLRAGRVLFRRARHHAAGLRSRRRPLAHGGRFPHALRPHGVSGSVRRPQGFHAEHARSVRPEGGIGSPLRKVAGAERTDLDRSRRPFLRGRVG